mgnify:CR=1 FL=1
MGGKFVEMPVMSRVLGLAVVLLLFVLPIPGTIALRHGLTLLALGLILLLWRSMHPLRADSSAKMLHMAGWLTVITLWILLQAGLFSEESRWAFKEITNQWLPALIAALIGWFAVICARASGLSQERVLGLIVLVFLAQAVFSLVSTFPDFLSTGAFPQSKTRWTAGKLEISYWNNIALAILAVDLLSRWRYRQQVTNLSLLVVGAGVLLLLMSNLAFGARNGIIGSIMLLVSLGVLVAWRERRRIGIAKTLALFLVASVLASLMAFGSLKLDPRWASFKETAAIAWDIKSHDAWLDPDNRPLPSLASGQPVEASAYLRISWIRAGIDLVADYPMGVGYGRNAFGHALRKTQETRVGHAHSGIIDWSVGTGLPGLVLWLGMIGSIIWIGLRRYFDRQDPTGLIVAFVAGGFLGRMMLDTINRDHMLMVFFMMLAILISLPERPVKE